MELYQIKNKEVERLNDKLGEVLRKLFIKGNIFPREAARGLKLVSEMYTNYRHAGYDVDGLLIEIRQYVEDANKTNQCALSLGMQIALIQIKVLKIDTIRASFLFHQIAAITSTAVDISTCDNESKIVSVASFEEQLQHIQSSVLELSRYLRKNGDYSSKQELAEDCWGKAYIWGWCKGVVNNCGIKIDDPKWHVAHIQAFYWAYDGVEPSSEDTSQQAKSIYWEFKKSLSTLSQADKHGNIKKKMALERIASLSEIDLFKGIASRNLFGSIDLHDHISYNRV